MWFHLHDTNVKYTIIQKSNFSCKFVKQWNIMHNCITYCFKEETHIPGFISFQSLWNISVEHILKSCRQDYHWFLFTARDLVENWCCSFSYISLNTCCLRFWHLCSQDPCFPPGMVLGRVFDPDLTVTQPLPLLGSSSVLWPELTACAAEVLEANLWLCLAPTIHSVTF